MFGNNPFADYKNYIKEKAESKAQQRLMGMAHAYNKGELPDASDEVKQLAKGMKKSSVKDFASTKHKGLPDRVGEDASSDDEEKFHQKLDKLVHNTFGKSDTEKEQEEGLAQARKNVGADSCWDGYKADGTKKKNGREVPNCVKEAKEVHIRLDYLDGDKRQKQITAMLQKFEDEGTIEFSGETDKGVIFNLNKPANLRSMNAQLQKISSGAVFEENDLVELSSKTLRSYAAKASDARGHRNLSTKKVDNRYKGVSTASRKLAKRDEEVEQVDELSKKTMANYVSKALDADKKERDAGGKTNRRHDGIMRAHKKLVRKEEVEEAKKITIKKLDKETLEMLKSLDDEEARLIIQGLPSSLRRKAMDELGLKEKVDGRTKAYKETVSRLMKVKEEFEEVDLEEEIELSERRAFIYAAAKAKANGKKTFEFHGKEYKVMLKNGPVVEADDEEVVKEGAVASATVRKEIQNNGGKQIGQNDKEIFFTMKGKKHTVPVYKNFVADKDYEKLHDMLNEAGYLDAKGKNYSELAKDVDNKKSRDLQPVKEDEVPPQFKKEEPSGSDGPDDGISDDERKFLKKYGLKRSELKIYRKVEALKKLKEEDEEVEEAKGRFDHLKKEPKGGRVSASKSDMSKRMARGGRNDPMSKIGSRPK